MKFKDHLKEQLKDPEFKREYGALESEHIETVGEIVERFGAHERLYKQQREKHPPDDLADIYPCIKD